MVRFCEQCGAQHAEGVRFCRLCGARLEPEEAAADLEERLRALVEKPDATQALALGHLFLASDRGSQAAEAFSLAVITCPEMPEAHLALAVTHLQASEPEKARPHLLSAIEQAEPGDLSAAARAYLSTLLLEEYDVAGADVELRQAEVEDPASFLVLWKRGEYFFRLGMYREAELALQAARRAEPPSKASAIFVARLLETTRERAKRSFVREPLLPQWGRALRSRVARAKDQPGEGRRMPA